MRRRIANFETATCVLMCAAIAVIWNRSYRRMDVIYRQAPVAWSIGSTDGGLTLGRRRYEGWTFDRATWRFDSTDVIRGGFGVRRWDFAGFGRGDVEEKVEGGGQAYTFRD